MPPATRGSNTTGTLLRRHLARIEPLHRALAGAFADLFRVEQVVGADRGRVIVVALHAGAGAGEHRGADARWPCRHSCRQSRSRRRARRCERLQPASAPSELVTPGTARAASSAAAARAISVSGAGSLGSSRSSAGQSRASSSGAARPQYGSSGTVLRHGDGALDRVRSAPPDCDRSRRRWPAACRSTHAGRDRSPPSARASRPCRGAVHALSEAPSNSTASAASAPAVVARAMRSPSRLSASVCGMSSPCLLLSNPNRRCPACPGNPWTRGTSPRVTGRRRSSTI